MQSANDFPLLLCSCCFGFASLPPGHQAFNHSRAAGELPTKSAAHQAGRKVLGCEGSRRQAGEISVGGSNFQSQVFLPRLGSISVSPVVSLALPGCETMIAEERTLFPHLVSSVQHGAGIWAVYSCQSLSHSGDGCIPAPCASAADVPDPHTECLFFQLSVPNCCQVTHQIPSKIPLPFSKVAY